MDMTRLLELKEQMVTATQFMQPWTFFLDHFGENQEFLDLCKPVKPKNLLSFIEMTLQKVHGKKKGKILDHRLVGLAEHFLVHGPILLRRHMVSVLFFSDIAVGILTVVEFGSTGHTQLLRISLKEHHSEIQANPSTPPNGGYFQ